MVRRSLRPLVLALLVVVLPSASVVAQTADTVDRSLFLAVKSLLGAVDVATRPSVPKLRGRYEDLAALFLRTFPGGVLPGNGPASLDAVLLSLRTRLQGVRQLAREEKSLKAESRAVMRLYESVRRWGERSSSPRVRLLLRTARQRLAQLEGTQAFRELRFPFIRNTLRAVRRDLEEARKRSATGGKREERLRALEGRFEALKERSAGDSRTWAVLRLALGAGTRARAALRKGQAELFDSHVLRFASLLSQAEQRVRDEERRGRAEGFEGPAREALAAARRLAAACEVELARSPLGRRLRARAIELLAEAETALVGKNPRRALERARLARRLLDRARREAEAGR